MRSTTSKLTLTAAAAAFLLGVAATAFAQTDAGTAPTQPLTKAEQRAQAKAKRKAEHKAARAKNTAELKKLEDAGYKPSANDPNYPQDLQDAEKKANAAPKGTQ